MTRSYLHPAAWNSSVLTGDEARHLTQVLRIQPGETITVFDGTGRHAAAVVTQTTRDIVSLSIGPAASSDAELPFIELAQAIPKGKNMDLIVQKAVELGASRIQPLITRNTIVRPAEHKAAKWRRTALEACKQCGRNRIPEIAEPMAIEPWLATSSFPNRLLLLASLAPGAVSLKDTFQNHPESQAATILIGPEGDFTAGETQSAIDAGFLPVSLGPIVLRVETAALYCLSVIHHELIRV